MCNEKTYDIDNFNSEDDSSSEYELEFKAQNRLTELMELIQWNLSFDIPIDETLRVCDISNDDIVLLLEHFML